MPWRWFPGHYMQCSDIVNRGGLADWKRPLTATNTNFTGYQVSVWWGQTEILQDNYAALFLQLDAIRAAARADNKKIWLRLMFRSEQGATARPNPMPFYIIDGSGTYSFENIYAPKLWDPVVKEKFLLWAEAAAEYCAANPEFVLLSSEELWFRGAEQQGGYSEQALVNLWLDFARRVTAKSGDCLVHTSIGQGVTNPPDFVVDKAIANNLLNYKVLLGPPHLRKDAASGTATLSNNFGRFIYNSSANSILPGYQGTAGFAIGYEFDDYVSLESPAEHLRWAVDELGINFIAWDPDRITGFGSTGSWTWAQALTAVNDAAGRINAARPLLLVDVTTPTAAPPAPPTAPTITTTSLPVLTSGIGGIVNFDISGTGPFRLLTSTGNQPLGSIYLEKSLVVPKSTAEGVYNWTLQAIGPSGLSSSKALRLTIVRYTASAVGPVPLESFIKYLDIPTSSMFERQQFTIRIETENIPNGARLGYLIAGVDPTRLNVPLRGEMVIQDNQGLLPVIVNSNFAVNDNAEITISFPGYPGISGSLKINDSSTVSQPAAAYRLEIPVSSVFQNQSFTVTVKSTTAANGTMIGYVITGVSSGRINVPLTGSITVNNGSGSLPITAVGSGDPTEMNISLPSVNLTGSVYIR